MSTPIPVVENPTTTTTAAEVDNDALLPPPPIHILHSSYSMPTFSGNPPNRPYDMLNPIAASARTSHTRVDLEDEEEEPSQPQEAPTQNQPPSPTAEQGNDNEKEKEKEKEKGTKDKNERGTSAGAEPQPEPQPPAAPAIPQTHVTFLLMSGKRRAMAFEPETTVGRIKELMWNSWPGDWQDERPPAPAYLRVLYLGKMLQDDDTLTKLKLPIHTPTPDGAAPIPTIVHISIRPSAPPGEGDAVKKGVRGRVRWNTETSSAGGDDANAGGCCGCIIC